MRRKMLKEERELRKFVAKNTDPLILEKRDGNRLITALVRAVQEDICKQVVDAIGAFPEKDQIKLMDTIMGYEKLSRRAGKEE